MGPKPSPKPNDKDKSNVIDNDEGKILSEASERAVKVDDENVQRELDDNQALVDDYFKKEEFTRTYKTKELKKNETQILKDRGITLRNELGSGAFAVVYKADYVKDNKTTTIAIKNIDISKKKERRIADLKNELYVLEKVNHRNIVRLYDHFIIDDRVFILMELADAGNMARYVNRHGALSEPRARRWFQQMCKAVHHMHLAGIAHRDLKINNVLLTKAGRDKTEALVSDFGLSRIGYRSDKGVQRCTTYCGTPPYMAPEIIDKNEAGLRLYDPMIADIWALGVCLYVMLNKAYPFNADDMSGMLRHQKESSFKFAKRGLTTDARNIISNMLEPDTVKRITFHGIYTHKWMEMKMDEISESHSANSMGSKDSPSKNSSKK